jgi:Bacterial lectin/PEP-CTERM motif
MKHTIILSSVVFAASLAISPVHAIAPVFSNGVGAGFNDFTTWSHYGSSAATNFTSGGFDHSVLSLTSTGIGDQGGAAFAPSTVTLDFNQPFTVAFHFYISPGTEMGDGMTFVLAPNDPETVNAGNPLVPSTGSDLGYGGTGLDGLAFAIDTYHFSGEPVAPSIQILQNSTVTPVEFTETGLMDIRDPSYFQWFTTLTYTPSGDDDFIGTLTGSIDQFIGLLSFSISAEVNGDLLGLHNTPVYYGFTAANGSADDGHHVSSSIPVIPEPGTCTMLLAGLAGLAVRRKKSRLGA